MLAALAHVSRPATASAGLLVRHLAVVDGELTALLANACECGSSNAVLLSVEEGADSAPAVDRVRRWAGAASWHRLDGPDILVRLRQLTADEASRAIVHVSAFVTPDAAAFVLSNDLDVLPVLAGQLQRQLETFGWSHTERDEMALAVREASLNALVHGNLALSAAHRVDEPTLRRTVAERQRTAPYSRRRILAWLQVSPATVTCTVKDEGAGFDVAAIPDPTAPENLLRSTGRGVSLIRALVDEVCYNEAGNAITMTKRRSGSRDGGSRP